MERPLASLIETLTLPGHRAVAQHWLTLYRAGGNRVPALASLDPLQFPAALPDIWIVNLEPDGGFRFHLLGEAMIAWQGSNPKGQRFEQIYTPAVLPVISGLARRVIERPAIAYQQGLSQTRNRSLPVPIERIALPLADREGRIRHLFGVTVYKTHETYGSGTERTELQLALWFPVAEAEIAAGAASA